MPERTERKSDQITSHEASEDMRRADIVMRGKKAVREINGAKLAAQKAWNEWRNLGTYKTPEGHVTVTQQYLAETIRVPKPGSDKLPNGQPCQPIMIEQQTGNEHPEHRRLREIAEAADRHVLDLQDDIDVYTAFAGNIGRRGR